MKPELKEILVLLNKAKSVNHGVELVEKHFASIGWSLEKDEWDRMSASFKKTFVKTVIKETK